MRILVFNNGSSSLKFQIFEANATSPVSILRGAVRGFGDEATCEWRYGAEHKRIDVSIAGHDAAAQCVLDLLDDGIIDAGQSLLSSVTAIAHRIVHGGELFTEATLITERTLAALETLNPLAPLHNPPALAVVRTCRERLGDIPMVAVFDTAFFQGLPDYVCAYALPAEWTQSYGIRRYGFHGLAHRYMMERYHSVSGVEPESSRVISLQLGHGCSVAALCGGRPMETSMGFTPLEGLIMATRPGDVDAGVVLNLIERGAVTVPELSDGLNHRAGLLGLSGISADMQTLLALEAQGHAGARLAVQAFCHRARKYLGAYLAVLGGADAIVFGGGIGERAADIRARICSGMEWCGLALDAQANQAALGVEARISRNDSRLTADVIPVDEEALIAQDTMAILN